jgi:molecular chaperone GrpE
MADQDPKTQAAGQTADPQSQENGSDPLQAELDALRNELEEARKLELRALADLENYRKRVARQMDDERRYASLPLARDLLPILDNLKRTVEAAQKTSDAKGLLEGVQMVIKQFYTALGKHHCEPIAALHQPFDPNIHEAILQQPSGEFPPNTVLQEVQVGFRLHDRVVRPSQVIVSSAPPQGQDGMKG